MQPAKPNLLGAWRSLEDGNEHQLIESLIPGYNVVCRLCLSMAFSRATSLRKTCILALQRKSHSQSLHNPKPGIILPPASAVEVIESVPSVSLCVGLWELYDVYYLNGTGLCCARPTCVVHHPSALCTLFIISSDRDGVQYNGENHILGRFYSTV